jgi:hypothetical protein
MDRPLMAAEKVICTEAEHQPRQHFDNKQAWCDKCGMNAYRMAPRDFSKIKTWAER